MAYSSPLVNLPIASATLESDDANVAQRSLLTKSSIFSRLRLSNFERHTVSEVNFDTGGRCYSPEQRKSHSKTSKLNATIAAMTTLAVSKSLSGLALSADELLAFILFGTELPDSDLDLYYQWTPITSFHLLSKLPVEIQVYIWKISRPHRKILAHLDAQNPQMLRCRTAVPQVLQVSREIRAEMLKHYTSRAHIPGFPNGRPALSRYYFDPTLDTVVLRGYVQLLCFVEHMHRAGGNDVVESVATLQSLMLGSTWWGLSWKVLDPVSTPNTPAYYRSAKYIMIRAFRMLSSLRSLVLVGGSYALKYDYQRALRVKSLTAMFKEFRRQDPGRGEVQVSVLMRCHRPGALECEKCWIGFKRKETRAKSSRAVVSGF